jgi:3-isopropylmalate/(R)-2-methylmalate dehydratase small subunit
MRALKSVTGPVAVLDRADVDTDQIIPKQFLKRIERAGYGEFLFFDWRKDPSFELPVAPILIAGRNFGCGSSREHAAWALEDYGFRVVLAPSFGDIFHQNSILTGMAPVEVPSETLGEIRAAVAELDVLTVDLEKLEISHPSGKRWSFDFDGYAQESLVHGLDEIARTLKRDEAIAAYEAGHPGRFDARAVAV